MRQGGKVRGIRGLVVLMLVSVMTGCSVNVIPPAPKPGPLDASAREQAEIYSAAIRQQCTADAPGNEVEQSVIYVVGLADDNGAKGSVESKRAVRISDSVRAAITASLADLGSEIRWVEHYTDVKRKESTGEVRGGGVLVCVGAIKRRIDGTVTVPTGIYYGNLGAGGQIYVLTEIEGVWKVTGTTGESWIS